MRKTSRLPLAAFFMALLVLFTSQAPATAADSLTKARQQREATRKKKAELARKIDSLKASDEELDNAVRALEKQVAAEQAAADAARQAVEAAVAALNATEARLADTEKQIGALHDAVVKRAVDNYVRPRSEIFGGVIATDDLGEASRRDTLLRQVGDRDRDVADQLRAARLDLIDQQEKAKKARDLVAERRKAQLAKLSSVQKALGDKARLSSALEARIKEYQDEADAVAREESGLVALIQRKEQERASRGGDAGIDGRVSGAGLIWPVRGPVTSGFGYRWGRLHAGIDIGAGSGTPIHAAKGGVVTFAGVMSGYGNVIIISHGGGFSTLYAHQSRLGASDGQEVSQGQVIGYVGSTGHSTGPHLHFETRVNGSPQDPRRYLP